MRLVFGLVLVVGLGLAGFAVYMAKNYIGAFQNELARERATNAKAIKTVGVWVAKRSVKYGEKLTLEDIELIGWPKKYLPEGVFTQEEPVFAEGVVQPRYVLRAMEKWEPVLALKVTEPGVDAGLTSRLEKGMRAFAIKVDVASGVSGFLRPGDKVDVYWTGRAPGATANARLDVTKLIETAVKLIAVDQTANGDTTEAAIAQTVTVAVSPQQVAALAQAQSTGRLSLSLVGTDDDSFSDVVEVDQRSLLGIAPEEEKSVLVEEEKVCTIKTRRGAEVVQIPIPCTN